MAGGATEAGVKYSRKIGFIYVFNLIIGTGALTLPLGFQHAGLILGVIFLAAVGTMAYMTATWLIEVQAIANAILPRDNSTDSHKDAEAPLLRGYSLNDPTEEEQGSIFAIERRVEVGLMAELFLGTWGKISFYAILVIYLFGDLAIYATVVPTSLAQVTGGWGPFSSSNVYYLYLAVFACLVTPFSLFNFQKTKPLQIVTLVTRNVAFFCMIILGIIFIANGRGASASSLKWFDISGLPFLFGASIYAFMCHHSLPSIITPIGNKNGIFKILGSDFFSIFIAYGLLCTSALFAFGDITNQDCTPTHDGKFNPCTIQSIYTLNFASYNVKVLADFLTLFPVLTLSTNYPLISITLRNNLLQLFPSVAASKLKTTLLSLAACLIPIGVAFLTRDSTFLVKITGSYAGLGIMIVMPVLLVHFARARVSKEGLIEVNPYQSPFQSPVFLVLVSVLSVVFLGLTIFNQIYTSVHH